jgi:tetratricopeptide (TPR) repeat protein
MHYIRRTAAALAALVLAAALAAAGPGDARRASAGDADRLLATGEFGRAAEIYRDLEPSAPDVRLRLAAALLKRERPAEAIAVADAAVAAAPTADAHALRALARFRAGRFRAAEADRDRARALPQAETALAHLADARLLLSDGRAAEALAAVERALAGPSLLDRVFRFDALNVKSDALDELERLDDALAAFEAAVEAAPPTNQLLAENLAAQLAFRRATRGAPYCRLAPGSPAEATLPLAVKHNLPIVYASLNGAPPAPFLLDTGAGISVLFPKYAKKAGFATRPERAWAGAVGGDGRVEIRYGLADRVGLGAVALERVPFAVIDWELPGLAGILGLPVLSPFLATIDYRGREVRLQRPAAQPAADAGVPFRLVSGAVFVEAWVDGKGPFNFEIDTGATTDTVPVDVTVAAAVGLSPELPIARTTRSSGAAGRQTATVYPNRRFSWGGMGERKVGLMSQPLTPARAERRDGESGLVAETELEGLIGHALLSRSSVTLDFVARRVRVE